MKVLFVSPGYFSKSSYIGGGERYAVELTRAIAQIKGVQAKLLSFGPKRKTIIEDSLKIEIYRPLFRWSSRGLEWVSSFTIFPLLKEVIWADIVHIHQYHTILAHLAITFSFLARKKSFVTDHGGGGFGLHRFPFYRLVTKFLCQTEFNRQLSPVRKCPQKMEIIYGGVDEKKFKPLELKRDRKILYVGRILPHKGINYLIEALDKKTKLVVVGKTYDQKYFRLLKKIAKDKNVFFKTQVGDEELVKEYNTSLVTVLPSVYTDVYGNYGKAPELLGLTLLESMACGTPVICTNVGGMPYIVKDGQTGFIVPPNNPSALREKIDYLFNHPSITSKMGRLARKQVEEKFTWEIVAQKCLALC